MSWKNTILNSKERIDIEAKILEMRQRTGVELNLAIVKKSSSYNLAHLRMAIFGQIMATCFILFFNPNWGDKSFAHMALVQVGSFLLGHLLSHFSWAKRHALTQKEIEKEIVFRSKEFFLNIHMPNLKSQSGILILYYLFEKRIGLVIDDHFKSKIRSNDLERIKELMNNECQSTHHYENLTKIITLMSEKITHFYPEGKNPSREFESDHHIHWPIFN